MLAGEAKRGANHAAIPRFIALLMASAAPEPPGERAVQTLEARNKMDSGFISLRKHRRKSCEKSRTSPAC